LTAWAAGAVILMSKSVFQSRQEAFVAFHDGVRDPSTTFQNIFLAQIF
jgi:hypothetical protein